MATHGGVTMGIRRQLMWDDSHMTLVGRPVRADRSHGRDVCERGLAASWLPTSMNILGAIGVTSLFVARRDASEARVAPMLLPRSKQRCEVM